MKKSISISLMFLMIASILHFSVAIHYCHGIEAASKISMSGEKASCGMENEEKDIPVSGTQLNSNCCDDSVVFYGVNPNYTPSSPVICESFQNNFQVLDIPPVASTVQSLAITNTSYTNISPPGALMSTNVDLSDICVFRI